ncbi:MAG: DUF559 domain-containing protein [Thermoleophilaceae bacterium]|nr:DUF559 domain-containing protein [Thermoleophilaceae bacterium]
MARRQLLGLGVSREAIAHRLAKGRLHRLYRGVYAVGRSEVSQEGRWMAAVLACGPGAALSHFSAAVLWGIRQAGILEVVAPNGARRRGIKVHRRKNIESVILNGIPVTTPAQTLVDIAPRLNRGELERAINEADKLDLIDPAELRAAVDELPPCPGAGIIRRLLDRQTFVPTDTELERLFIPLALDAGLGVPLTQEWVNGFKVDFYWPELGLVVETDGGRFHRTPAQQTADRLRDQTHLAAGLTPVRFTWEQVKYERPHVRSVLARVAERLR